MNLEHKIKLLYPYPICKMYESVRLEGESRHRVRKLMDLVEGTTKYLALIGLAYYLQLRISDDNINKVRQECAKPSFGNWVGLYRALFTFFENQNHTLLATSQSDYKKDEPVANAAKTLRKAISSQSKSKQFTQFSFLDAIVEFRNDKIGHGTLGSKVASEVLSDLENGINQWLNDLLILESRQLVYIRCIEFETPLFINMGINLNNGASVELFQQSNKMGLANKQVYLFDVSSNEYLPLHPLFLYDESVQYLYMYSKVKNDTAILEVPYTVASSDLIIHTLDIDTKTILGGESEKAITNAVPASNVEDKEENQNIVSNEPEMIKSMSKKDDWRVRTPIQVEKSFSITLGVPDLIAMLLLQRGFNTPEKARAFLNPGHYAPAPPTALFGVAEAAQILHDFIQAGKNIFVWGDFDVDGQTSTSLLVAALQKLAGVERVRFHVPNRFTEGHGIRPPKLQEKLADPTFPIDLLLTCDTGIADTEGVTLAKAHGLTVVITDHHDLTAEFDGLTPGKDQLWGIPNTQHATRNTQHASVRFADAIVNPKFQPIGDPLRTLPGVGVAYKLMQQLYHLSGRGGEESEFLDLVALGIVADVAEQVNDARYLLQLGLEKLRTTKRIGLRVLMETARLNPETVDADSIGFQLGPRMNALGRLEDATVAVELLTTRDIIRAQSLAGKMERLNQERRVLTSQIAAAAMDMIDRDPKLLDYNGLVLAHPNWHAGIVGIVASRLVEEFGKPTVLLLTPPGEAARGSARSIIGVDIGGSIAACSHLLLHHGGHPGAAGLGLLPENIDAFRRELSRQIELHRDDSIPTGLQIDAEAPLNQVSLILAEELQRLGPFGNGNPTPQFLSSGLTVIEDRRLGREGTHRKLTVQSADGAKAPVIWFNGADVELPAGPVDLVYTIGINEYRGERNLQLSFVAIRPAQEATVVVRPRLGPLWRIEDLRNQPISLAALPQPTQALWYAEGVNLGYQGNTIDYQPRMNLLQTQQGQALVLWSIPPSPGLLQWLAETTQPAVIYLCGQQTSDDSLPGMLRNVAGMCKYALQRDGLLQINRMAARLGTTEAVIRHSLLWLDSRGQVRLIDWDPEGTPTDTVHIAAGSGVEQRENRELLQSELDEQLAEVRAYRRFFLRATVKELGV